MNHPFHKNNLVLAVSISLFLSACGGGSGGDNPAPTPTPQVDVGPLLLIAGDIADVPLHARGAFNDWATTPFVENNGIYLTNLELTQGDVAFKVADQDWQAGTDCGVDNGSLQSDQNVLNILCSGPGNGNVTLEVPSAGQYTVAFSYADSGESSLQFYPSITESCDEDPPTTQTLSVTYLRSDDDYSNWQLHASGKGLSYCVNHPALLGLAAKSQSTSDGAQWTLPVVDDSESISVAFRRDNQSGASGAINIALADTTNSQVWLLDGDSQVYPSAEAAIEALQNLGNQSRFLDLSDVAVGDVSSPLPTDWAETANFMEIYVRGYQDSDGDGVGDIQGLISRLDYLEELGITGIWLMPVHESTDNDHGYQVQDYRDIEDDYGSVDDFRQLLQAAHDRGIGIIMDYVINHSSNSNPLFKDADFGEDNDKRDWYIFSQSNPGWTSFSGNSWHQGQTGFYYGVFFGGMPDFNLRNQDVIDFHHNNLRFWLNMGVDGFRFDATGLLIENGANAWEDQEDNHPILLDVRNLIDQYDSRFAVCESPADAARYAQSDSCGRAFAFGTQFDIINSADIGTLRSGLVSALNSSVRDNAPLILSNHDSFAGDRMGTRFASNETDYRVASAIYLLASSTPFTYYGEEIGMSNGAGLQGDASLRTPMSWTNNTEHAGFSNTAPFRSLSGNASTNNVAAQQADQNSLYHFYKAIYQLRNNNPVLATGEFTLLSQTGDPTLVFTRSNEIETLLVTINLSSSEQSIEVDTGEASAQVQQLLPSSDTPLNTDDTGNLQLQLPAKSMLVTSW
jgi:alpha-amylase